MATVYTYLPGLVTGDALTYPIVMRAGGLNVDDYVMTLEVKDDEEFAIGDLVMVTTGTLLLDQTAAKDFTAFGVVYDSNRNFATMEKNGVTVSKTATTGFKDGDKIDILLLVPGMILSLDHDGTAAIDVGDDVRAAAGGQCAALAAIATDVDPRAKIGTCLSLGVGTGTRGRIAVMIK